jgi:O-antigen ligase
VFLILMALLAATVGGVAISFLSVWGLLLLFLLLAGALLALLRWDEELAVGITVVALLVDWYQILPLPVLFPAIATGLALATIALTFLAPSTERPWTDIPDWKLFVALLVLAIVPVVRGISLLGDLRYYVTVLFTPFLLYVLGVHAGLTVDRLRRLMSLLAAFGAIVGLHSIIQAKLGITLFASPYWNDYLATVDYYRLPDSGDIRAGSFLINPDSNGVFLAMLLFLPVGLLLASPSWRARALYGAETALMLLGLLYTYTAGSFVAAGGGALVLLLLAPRISLRWLRSRIVIAGAAVLALGLATVGFLLRSSLTKLVEHASAPHDIVLRVGAWETGLRVIAAYPLTGVGLSLDTYAARATPYRAALETHPLAHPHNSFIEIAALAGLPIALLYIALIARGFVRAFRRWRAATVPAARALYAGAIAALATLTLNSLEVNGWTFAAVAAIGWLLLGAASSGVLKDERSHGLLTRLLAALRRSGAGAGVAKSLGASGS